MIEEFGLATPPLPPAGNHGARRRHRAARAVTGSARTACGVVGPVAHVYHYDLAQLEAGIALYDAFYRWCRDATDETHNWPTNKAKP